jgi:hypothetical protein
MPKLAAEIWRIAAMRWSEFAAFVASHEYRRFVLEQ